MRVIPAVAIVLMGVAGCQAKTETAEQARARMETESAAAKTAIDSLAREFANHMNMGHADVVAGFYAADAVVMPPNMPAAKGQDGARQVITEFVAMKAQLTLTPTAVTANGPTAVDQGTYSVTFTPPGAAAPMTDTGKYLAYWRQSDGKWLMVYDIWNSDLPAAPMPAGKP